MRARSSSITCRETARRRSEASPARAAPAALGPVVAVVGEDRVDPVAQQGPQPDQLRPVAQQRP
jgi:hypothetical protein